MLSPFFSHDNRSFFIASLLLCSGCHSGIDMQKRSAFEQSSRNTLVGSSISATQTSSAMPPTSAVYAAHGKVTSVTLKDDRLTSCDTSGAFAVALPEGSPNHELESCKPHKLEGACPETKPVLDTRHPPDGAQDVIDTENNTFFLAGDIRDCAVNGRSIAVTTSSGVLLLDDATGKKISLSSESGEHIALNKDWVAWSAGQTIHAKRHDGF